MRPEKWMHQPMGKRDDPVPIQKQGLPMRIEFKFSGIRYDGVKAIFVNHDETIGIDIHDWRNLGCPASVFVEVPNLNYE